MYWVVNCLRREEKKEGFKAMASTKGSVLEKPKVSVIIPVYNVEEYLCQCLDSVLRQTMEDLEIILLNDGSTDNSAEICKEYEEKDYRIKYFSHENKGLGETRNRGIDLAIGEYLFFVDSDDYLSCDYIETLYNSAVASGADIVQGESKMFFEDGRKDILESDLSKIENIIVDPEMSEDFFKTLFFTHIYKHYAWNKLYRTSFVKAHQIRFGDNKRIFAEDTWFQLQAFHYKPFIAFVSGSYYFYRQRATSIMHTVKKDLLKRQATMIDDYNIFLKRNQGSALESKVCGMIAMDVFTMEALNQILTDGNFSSYRTAIKSLRDFSAIKSCIISFNKNRAFDLEVKPFRKKYLRLVSNFYKCKLDLLAQLVVWWTYKVMRG